MLKTRFGTFTLVILTLASLSAEARPARPRPPGGDVHMTISTREQLIVLAVFNSVNPQTRSYDTLVAMMTLDQALGLDEARAWAKANPKANLFAAPDDPKAKTITRAEAAALVEVMDIKPTKERPIDFATGKILLDVHGAAQDALAAAAATKSAAKPVASKP